MEKKHKIGLGECDYETEIIIRDTCHGAFRTLTVEENGKVYFQQTVLMSDNFDYVKTHSASRFFLRRKNRLKSTISTFKRTIAPAFVSLMLTTSFLFFKFPFSIPIFICIFAADFQKEY